MGVNAEIVSLGDQLRQKEIQLGDALRDLTIVVGQ